MASQSSQQQAHMLGTPPPPLSPGSSPFPALSLAAGGGAGAGAVSGEGEDAGGGAGGEGVRDSSLIVTFTPPLAAAAVALSGGGGGGGGGGVSGKDLAFHLSPPPAAVAAANTTTTTMDVTTSLSSSKTLPKQVGNGHDSNNNGDNLLGHAAEEEDAPWCVCRQPDLGEFMIHCDFALHGVCKNWYHGDCVDVSKYDVTPDTRWICPLCAASVRGSGSPLPPDVSLTQLTGVRTAPSLIERTRRKNALQAKWRRKKQQIRASRKTKRQQRMKKNPRAVSDSDESEGDSDEDSEDSVSSESESAAADDLWTPKGASGPRICGAPNCREKLEKDTDLACSQLCLRAYNAAMRQRNANRRDRRAEKEKQRRETKRGQKKNRSATEIKQATQKQRASAIKLFGQRLGITDQKIVKAVEAAVFDHVGGVGGAKYRDQVVAIATGLSKNNRLGRALISGDLLPEELGKMTKNEAIKYARVVPPKKANAAPSKRATASATTQESARQPSKSRSGAEGAASAAAAAAAAAASAAQYAASFMKKYDASATSSKPAASAASLSGNRRGRDEPPASQPVAKRKRRDVDDLLSSMLDRGTVVWEGLMHSQGSTDAVFNMRLRFEGGDRISWLPFPVSLATAGRMQPAKLQEFINRVCKSNEKKRAVVLQVSSSSDQDVHRFRTFASNFERKNRAAVVDMDKKIGVVLYLIPQSVSALNGNFLRSHFDVSRPSGELWGIAVLDGSKYSMLSAQKRPPNWSDAIDNAMEKAKAPVQPAVAAAAVSAPAVQPSAPLAPSSSDPRLARPAAAPAGIAAAAGTAAAAPVGTAPVGVPINKLQMAREAAAAAAAAAATPAPPPPPPPQGTSAGSLDDALAGLSDFFGTNAGHPQPAGRYAHAPAPSAQPMHHSFGTPPAAVPVAPPGTRYAAPRPLLPQTFGHHHPHPPSAPPQYGGPPPPAAAAAAAGYAGHRYAAPQPHAGPRYASQPYAVHDQHHQGPYHGHHHHQHHGHHHAQHNHHRHPPPPPPPPPPSSSSSSSQQQWH